MKPILPALRLIGVSLLLLVWIAPASATSEWKITKTKWTTADELAYMDFVAALGKDDCKTLDECLKSEANPYRSADERDWKIGADCADLPYLLRAYFAAKNGLPFSFASDVNAAPPPEGAKNPTTGSDVRYSPYGNVVADRFDVVTPKPGSHKNLRSLFVKIRDTIATGMFRMDPKQEAHNTGLFPDFYSSDISRKGIRPGTVIYDPSGHVGVVYEVTKYGHIRYMDAHPDNSLTRKHYGQAFDRSRPSSGAGFKNFRNLELVGARMQNDGTHVGGQVVSPLRNDQYSGFSLVQFYGTHPDARNWAKGRFLIDDREVDYYDYVREKLTIGNLLYDPIEELTFMLQGLCLDLKDRLDSVNVAINEQLNEKPHPERLPRNIYGTSGEWESYSTPSRDARFRTTAKEMHDRAISLLERYKKNDPKVQYSGNNLKADLLVTYNREMAGCRIQYKNSVGALVPLTLNDVMDRLFKLSFDPYHCIELRWGAPEGSRERQTCSDSNEKLRWYNAEQSFRNTLKRNYEARMDFTIEELESANKKSPVTAPKINLGESLQLIKN